MKKRIALFLALCMIISLIGCSGQPAPSQGSTAAPESTQAPETTPASESAAPPETQPGLPKLDGFKFVMGDWWSPAVYEEKEPQSAWDQLQRDYHHELMEKMDFTFEEIGLQNQGDYASVLVNSFINKTPACSAFQVQAEQLVPMAAQGLLADLSKYIDLSADMWNDQIAEYFTINGVCYAARPDLDQPRLGVFFNKQLFEDAGIDPELPYELQEKDEWDWAHFEELCRKLTQDKNNDGVTDVYALNSNDCDLLSAGIYSNGAVFVGKDENGKFVDGTLDPAFQEGMEWAIGLIEKGYVNEFGQGEAWDRAYTDFANNKCAMLISSTWITETYLKDMGEFGYVMLPKGTAGGAHICSNMYPTPIAIPACLGEENIKKAAAVIENWYNTRDNIPEAELMGITFRDDYYNTFRDAASVDQTISRMLTEDGCQIYDSRYLIPNYEYYGILVEAAARTATAAEKIEQWRPMNQAAIDAANAMFGH